MTSIQIYEWSGLIDPVISDPVLGWILLGHGSVRQ